MGGNAKSWTNKAIGSFNIDSNFSKSHHYCAPQRIMDNLHYLLPSKNQKSFNREIYSQIINVPAAEIIFLNEYAP